MTLTVTALLLVEGSLASFGARPVGFAHLAHVRLHQAEYRPLRIRGDGEAPRPGNIGRFDQDPAARGLNALRGLLAIIHGEIDQPVRWRIAALARKIHHAGDRFASDPGQMIVVTLHAAVGDLPAEDPVIESRRDIDSIRAKLIPA